jgi:hypothetical protein
VLSRAAVIAAIKGGAEGLMGMRDAAITAANNAHMHGYELGKQDALAAAVQRVKALAGPTQWRPEPRKTAQISEVIAAIKGES